LSVFFSSHFSPANTLPPLSWCYLKWFFPRFVRSTQVGPAPAGRGTVLAAGAVPPPPPGGLCSGYDPRRAACPRTCNLGTVLALLLFLPTKKNFLFRCTGERYAGVSPLCWTVSPGLDNRTWQRSWLWDEQVATVLPRKTHSVLFPVFLCPGHLGV
jgi:hypothetical protein